MRAKLISLLLTVAMVCGMLCALPMTATAADSGKCGWNLTWTFDNGTLTIDGTGDMDHYDSYWHPQPWRDYCDSITTIQINEGVKSIGGYAFCGFSSLTDITIPNSLTSITSQAFWSCSALTSITIPSGVTFIDSNAFQGCLSLTDIYVNENNQNYASVDGILYTKDKTGLIVCPGGKKEVEIFNGVTSIEKWAFCNCDSLTSISIPDSVTSIGDSAFRGCDGLTSITISDSVTSIGEYAFSRCNSLASITIPNSVASIGDYAFYYSTSLASIAISSGVTGIGDFAFEGCNSLVNIHVDENNTHFTSVDGVLYNKEKTQFICCPVGKKEVEIYNGVTSIEKDAFRSCDGLTSVSIPDSVTSIGDSAFARCENLTSITIPSSVTHIGNGAFSDCTSLTNITIPNSVRRINNYVFYGCKSLTSIAIPEGVTVIGAEVFVGCTSLTSITIPDSVWDIGYGAFDRCSAFVIHGYNGSYAQNYANKNKIPFVEIELMTSGECGDNLTWTLNDSGTLIISGTGEMWNYNSYANGMPSHPWRHYLDRITAVQVDNGVTDIGNYAFYYCGNLTSVTISDSVTHIGNTAFSGCTSLTSITIPDSVTSIESGAFSDCTSLTSITIPNGVTHIGNAAFSGCTGLTSITIPDSVWDIGYGAFSGCTGLTSITIPNGVTSVEFLAFANCSSLTSITIPDSVTSIEEYAFANCSSLTSITIPNSVKWIEYYAFSNCSSLTSITIPDSVRWIEDDAIIDCPLLTIYGCDGSYAQKYADENNIKFVTGMMIGEKVFSDVNPGAWYESAVKYAIENSVFNGMSETKFEPDTVMTRAMLVKVLYNLEGNLTTSEYDNPFNDVKEGQWYTEAVKWAAVNKIVYGTTDTTFSPDEKISREQLSTILYRYSQFKGYDVSESGDLTSFPDGENVSDYAEDAIKWAVGVGLISGNKIGSVNMLDARGSATRAQVAMILMKFSATVAA